MNASLSGQLARTLFDSQPGPDERQRARDGLIDYFACLLPVHLGLVRDSGLAPLRGVFPVARSMGNHALQLGYMSHALDFDDYHATFRGHPTTVVLSTLLALLEDQPPMAVEAFLDAYIVGVELAGRLGKAIGTRHYAAGLHSTATLGVIAATGAACRLLRLTQEQSEVALGLAATQASGLRAQFGSAAKALHAGLAARGAVNSVELAHAGFAAQRQGVLESFLAALGYGVERPDDLLAGWGAPWRIISPGLEFKRYPTCGGTHSAAEAAFVLRERLGGALDAVQHIEVSFPPGADTAPNITAPVNGVQARFSLEYVIADGLLNGAISLERYGEEAVDTRIAELAARVRRVPDPRAPADELDPDRRFHRVTLFMADGTSHSHCVTRLETAAVPTDVLAKLRTNLRSLPEARLAAISGDLQLADDAALHRLASLIRCQ